MAGSLRGSAVLEAALSAPERNAADPASFARTLFAPLGGVEAGLLLREPARNPPSFDGGQLASVACPSAATRSFPPRVPPIRRRLAGCARGARPCSRA